MTHLINWHSKSMFNYTYICIDNPRIMNEKYRNNSALKVPGKMVSLSPEPPVESDILKDLVLPPRNHLMLVMASS